MAETKTTSVGEDFPRQQARVRELIAQYREIGPAGNYGVMIMERSLREADAAMASGDIVRILAAYQDMRDFKE